MGLLEDRILFESLAVKGYALHDRRQVASEEYFTMGDPSLPNPTDSERENLARHIYSRGTPARTLSRDWAATDLARRSALPDRGRPGRMPYSPVSETGGRRLGAIRAAVLHQMRFDVPPLGDVPGAPPGDDVGLRRYIEDNDHRVDHVIAHFAVLRDGSMAYLRDVTHALNSVSARSAIDIEFAGRYPWDPAPPTDADRRATPNQIRAGRALVNALRLAFGITTIVTHGQVQEAREGKLDLCPGPDIWVNVGLWCESNLGLSTSATSVFGEDNGFGVQNNPAYDQHV